MAVTEPKSQQLANDIMYKIVVYDASGRYVMDRNYIREKKMILLLLLLLILMGDRIILL
jgi:hypothetical protein